jgi:putative DNA methylase
MTWEFAEANPFSHSSGNWTDGLELTTKALEAAPAGAPATVLQLDATASSPGEPSFVVSTDPPYYDNIPYADLSDLFYIWLRRSLGSVLPSLFKTVLVPKASELIADQHRHESKGAAEAFFRTNMAKALDGIRDAMLPAMPTTIFYAFKQTESTRDGAYSTGWETFLSALIQEELMVVGTWPVRTEQTGGLRNQLRNSLASSIVLVCRKRPVDAPTISRTEFRRLLRAELPAALHALERGNIAPVDMAQATIGPGMEIFSRHRAVLGSDDRPLEVRDALVMINEALDERLLAEEGTLDAHSRFAVTWFETNGFKTAAYGLAEDLAKARNVSVEGVAAAGILHSAASKVRLLGMEELEPHWDRLKDTRPTAWEAVHHLIRQLDQKGEAGAAELLACLGSLASQARLLAYRLYNICERKGWAEEGRAYNALVTVWPDLEAMAVAGQTRPHKKATEQGELFARPARGGSRKDAQ